MNTAHANIRCQQRGIPPIVIELLLQFGRWEHDHAGAEIIYFDGSARKKIQKHIGTIIEKLSGHLDSYAVMAEGKVVTVGTRYKRIKLH